MKRVIVMIFILFLFTTSLESIVNAHSGRTDSSGGHNCSAKSQAKGLCTGYHYHNGGGSTTTTTSNQSWEKDCSEFSSYDEVVEYWNSKGYSATYDPERLDGWGNAVDDGIPCEAPNGYDKTKINNSPEQIQYKQDQVDQVSGEKAGFAQGEKDGYQEVKSNNETEKGSAAYKVGYRLSYLDGYEKGKKKINKEKKKASEEGYELGKKQEKLSIPKEFSSHDGLKQSFEKGFNQAVLERTEAKKKEYYEQGYEDGKQDAKELEEDLEEVYLKAYQEGYEKGQTELRDSYIKQGYDNAFLTLAYEEPKFNNKKYIEWYKEGFDSNKEVNVIQEKAYNLGIEGETYQLPQKSKKSEVIFKHFYEKGYKEYEVQEMKENAQTAGGMGAILLGWLARRFYVAKKMIG